MPVVVRNTDRTSVSTPLLVGIIAVVVLVVLFVAYRMFGPSSDGDWDNTREGPPVSGSALTPPPPVNRLSPGASQSGPAGRWGSQMGGGTGVSQGGQ